MLLISADPERLGAPVGGDGGNATVGGVRDEASRSLAQLLTNRRETGVSRLRDEELVEEVEQGVGLVRAEGDLNLRGGGDERD